MKGYKIRGKTSEKIFRRKRLFRQIHLKSKPRHDENQRTYPKQSSLTGNLNSPPRRVPNRPSV